MSNMITIFHAAATKIQIQQGRIAVPEADDQVGCPGRNQVFFGQIVHFSPKKE
jgi:hypothetical protein